MHFSETAEKFVNIDGLPYLAHPPCVQGRALNFCLSGRTWHAPCDVTHHTICANHAINKNLDFPVRRAVSMAVH